MLTIQSFYLRGGMRAPFYRKRTSALPFVRFLPFCIYRVVLFPLSAGLPMLPLCGRDPNVICTASSLSEISALPAALSNNLLQ